MIDWVGRLRRVYHDEFLAWYAQRAVQPTETANAAMNENKSREAAREATVHSVKDRST